MLQIVVLLVIIINLSLGVLRPIDVNGSQPIESQSSTTTEVMMTRNVSLEEDYFQLSNLSLACNESHCNESERCIPLRKLCDGRGDCRDDANCTRNYTGSVTKPHVKDNRSIKLLRIITDDSNDNCSLHEFRCVRDGGCVNNSWRCDGRNDCGDWSDERYCGDDHDHDHDGEAWNISLASSRPSIRHKFPSNDSTICNATEFHCQNGRCILIDLTCDLVNHCGDWSDEKYCGDHLFDVNMTRPNRRWRKGPCNETEFSCNSNETCIPLKWRCDHNNDCQDSSDEDDCVYSTKRPMIPMESYFQFIYPINGSKKTCNSSEEFHCNREDICIGLTLKCDGKEDCLDGSDEKECGSTGKPKMKDHFKESSVDNNSTKTNEEKKND